MQTKLMTALLLLTASLLWTPPTFAATQTKAQTNTVQSNQSSIGTASQTKHHARHIALVYCDLHVCKDEKPHYIGTASYYGKHYWQGRKMANGKPFDYRKLTAASWGIPLGTVVRVTNLQNGKSVIVEITDRGPAHNLHRVADLSQAAAEQLDYTHQGLTQVLIQPVLHFETEPAIIEARFEEEKPVDPVLIAGIIDGYVSEPDFECQEP